jgi:hypothetical protein
MFKAICRRHHLFVIISAIFLFCIFGGTASAEDTEAPQVWIDWPQLGETIASTEYWVKAHATDNVGVIALELQVDNGTWLDMAWNSYEQNWQYHWTNYTEGEHTIRVRAWDAAGNSSLATIDVTVVLTYTISGHIIEPDGNTPVEGVLVDANSNSGSPDVNDAVTDVNGYYEVVVDYNWSGTVTPLKEGYTFEPNGISYGNVVIDEVNDYTATLTTFAIAGYILESDGITPISDVNICAENGGGQWTSRYGGSSDMTDANGYYEVRVDYNWDGNVSPTKYAYGFEPNRKQYFDVNSDQNSQDYTGRLLTFAISGYIRNDCNVPIAGVLVDANTGGGESVTDVNGFYEVWVDYNWSGTVTPGKAYYTFAPTDMNYVDVLSDQTNQNYQAANIYDLDCDGSIGYGDIAVISDNWLETGEDIPGDFYKDDDDIVNFLDFADFANVWGD